MVEVRPDIATSTKRRFWRWASFPLTVLVLFVALVTLDLNGSSMAAISTEQPAQGLVAGTPRTIRSDEFQLRTPIALSSVQQGLARTPWIGLAPTSQIATAHGGPTAEWPTLLKPQDWGYLFLGASRGLAWSWWWSFAVSLWGSYALLGLLTRRPGLSAGLAVAATFTPYAAWWTAPPPSLFVGYASIVGAAILASWIARSRALSWVWSIAAGLTGSALVLALYPPWQVSLAFVVAAACFGYAIDHRIPIRRVATSLLATAAIAGAILLAWYVQNRDAIGAIVNTYYPGQRITRSGSGSWSMLLSAPLNFWMTGPQGASLGAAGRGGPFSNLSEGASTWLPVPVLALVIAGVVLLIARRASRPRPPALDDARPRPRAENLWVMSLLSGVVLLLLVWTFAPLPDWFGRVTMLNRVQPSRTVLALGFAFIILIAVGGEVRERPRIWTRWHWLAAAGLSGVLTAWAATALPWDRHLISAKLALLAGLVLGLIAVWVLAGPRRTLGAAAFGVFAFLSWMPVNPLMQGTAPLTEDPLSVRLVEIDAAGTNPRAVVFGGFDTIAKVRSAGMQSVSGTTLYPDLDVMEAILPGRELEWNNYMQYLWTPGEPGSSADLEQIRGTLHRLTIDPCDPSLIEAVDPGWVISDSEIEGACLSLLGTVEGRSDSTLRVYAVVDATAG